MASTSTSKASSSTSRHHSYDVFLSFRGADTRTNFTDHLYNALIAHGIRTFRDDEELRKGGDIKSGLLTAIEESKIFVIIFSKNYATSKWCLNELVKIMSLEEARVIPVFYHVNPSDVEHQRGDFGEAFINHEKDANQERKEMIKKWRTALGISSKLSGYHVNNQHETQVIQDIHKKINTILDRCLLHVGDNIIGMDDHLIRLKGLMEIGLDDVCMIGIFGIGGIGKTTIAMSVYNDISRQFDGSSFLKGISEEYSKGGLLDLQKKLVKDILKDKNYPEFNNTNEGINVIKDILLSKRVLIVLDDVDEIEQLRNLVGKNDWFVTKSRIIITTKNTGLLAQHGVIKSYEVKKLELDESTKLFKLWAFKQNVPDPKEEFESLSCRAVNYADGLPIALKVLGGFLSNKRKVDEWKSALSKIEKIPDKGVQSILQVSYDKLDDICQSMFLDIACFFKGEDKDFVARILGEHAEFGISALHERCLIDISENKLDMHDLIQQMGQEIVRQECPKEPGKRSRLWDRDDIDDMLTTNSCNETIEGLFIEIRSNQMQLATNAFRKMNRLRLLKVYHKAFWLDFQVVLSEDFEFPSWNLRYLHFYGYPLESLPTNFQAKNLAELYLIEGNIKQLWKGNQLCDNLKVIKLIFVPNLVEIPDFSSMPNLEILILDGCKSLESLPRNFHKLEHLQTLSCRCCPNLQSFPEMKGHMSKLRKIDFSETAIREVPHSIEFLNGLEDLVLKRCKHLVILPENIGSLSSLQNLNLAGCSELKVFPELKEDMKSLEMLDLSETAIEELPSSIEHLKALKRLDLSDCKNLVNLPDSICNLSSLETLKGLRSSKIQRLQVNLIYWICPPDFHILEQGVIWSNDNFSSLKTLNLQGNRMEGEILNCPPLSSLVELSKTNPGPVLGHVGFPPLEVLSVGNSSPLERGILRDIICHESSNLESLSLRNFNLMQEGIPWDIWNPSALQELSLSNCNLMEGGEFLNHIRQLSSLQRLTLDRNPFSSLSTAGICRLPNLRVLNLRHCKNLLQIPELPSSLQLLDAHRSDRILSSPSLWTWWIHSAVNYCKSEEIYESAATSSSLSGEGMGIVIPRSSRILKGIRNQSKGSDRVTIELPQNWYENDDFLGFTLCCVYICTHGNDGPIDFNCRVEIEENNGTNWAYPRSFKSFCYCCDDDGVSDIVWMIYFPKVAIGEKWHFNQRASLSASFPQHNNIFEVKECGVHFLYTHGLKRQPKHKLSCMKCSCSKD